VLDFDYGNYKSDLMILEFSVTNTFSIQEKQTISFEAVQYKGSEDLAAHCIECGNKKILKLACIYGANASGKTNMLGALCFYMQFMLRSFTQTTHDENINVIPFQFTNDVKQTTSEFELIVYMKERETNKYIRYNYELKLTREKVLYEVLSYMPNGKKRLIFSRTENSIKWGSRITGEKKTIDKILRSNASVISTAAQVGHPLIKFFYDNIYFSFRGMVNIRSIEDLYSYVLDRVEKDEVFKKILIVLLSASDIGTINDIQIKLEDFPDMLIKQFSQEFQEQIVRSKQKLKTVELNHKYNENNYMLPLVLESEGTKRFMQLALPLYDLIISKSIVVIDELESSLHRALVELFLKLFIELSDESQLLFTTHNQDLLDSNLLRDDEVWFCYKTEKGNSVYNSITDYTGIQAGISRKALYSADKFGALPQINFYLLKELLYAKKNGNNQE